jgi:hypothetical protein
VSAITIIAIGTVPMRKVFRSLAGTAFPSIRYDKSFFLKKLFGFCGKLQQSDCFK